MDLDWAELAEPVGPAVSVELVEPAGHLALAARVAAADVAVVVVAAAAAAEEVVVASLGVAEP